MHLNHLLKLSVKEKMCYERVLNAKERCIQEIKADQNIPGTVTRKYDALHLEITTTKIKLYGAIIFFHLSFSLKPFKSQTMMFLQMNLVRPILTVRELYKNKNKTVIKPSETKIFNSRL